jgi:hypothetical protein
MSKVAEFHGLLRVADYRFHFIIVVLLVAHDNKSAPNFIITRYYAGSQARKMDHASLSTDHDL